MKIYKTRTKTQQVLADTITPVSIFLKIRDIFPNSVLLESSDYHGNKNSYSFIGLNPVANFTLSNGLITEEFPNGDCNEFNATEVKVTERLHSFINAFEIEQDDETTSINGIFGYTAFDAIPYFENIKFNSPLSEEESIPEVRYSFYKYIIAINHYQNNLLIIENLFEGEEGDITKIRDLLSNRDFAAYNFKADNNESSNLTDEQYMQIVTKGKEHCFRGDVFQIVLSRQFSQKYKGDDFNVYRALRSINPSPYLFYFDYGSYRLFGSSPEVQIEIKNQKAYIHPIAGTFRRTGDDNKDRELAKKLLDDKKENAEHVMLVDLARNDLSRNAANVTVERYKEIQFYSHVLHMVSVVSGELPDDVNPVKVMADSFPAGTLSGAPKYKAMELIDKYEKKRRGYYGGCIGQIGFNGSFNHAIMIRSFLSKNNTLYYQAGAGIVSESKEENELNEVNNKLAALKKAINIAKDI